jgi:hypothetical protein
MTPPALETTCSQLRQRMAELLASSPDPGAEMLECNRLLSESLDVSPPTDSQRSFLDNLFSNGTGQKLASLAAQFQVDPANAESPSDLILRLLPSDGHLT